MWRPFLEGKVGRDLLELSRHVANQEAYGKTARQLIHDLDLDLGEAEQEAESEDSEGEGEDADQSEDQSDGGEGAAAGAQGALEGGVPEHQQEEGQPAGAEEIEGELDARRRRRRSRPPRPSRQPAAPRPQQRSHRLPRLHHRMRRDGGGRGAVRSRRADAAARPARPAARPSAERHRPARQPPAAPPAGQADARLGVRSRGRHARCRAAVAHRHQPGLSALLQAREGDRFPRHGGDAADRQFRLDARPADHRRGDERRHPGAHPGALRRQGRDPGLHHPRLEGRPIARALDRRRQARQSRPPQRSAPHHLQAGRRAVAARAALARADAARRHPQGEHRRRGAALGAQPPHRPHRAAPHPDGHLRRRAGRRLAPSRSIPATISSGICARSSPISSATRRSSWSPSASATT